MFEPGSIVSCKREYQHCYGITTYGVMCKVLGYTKTKYINVEVLKGDFKGHRYIVIPEHFYLLNEDTKSTKISKLLSVIKRIENRHNKRNKSYV